MSGVSTRRAVEHALETAELVEVAGLAAAADQLAGLRVAGEVARRPAFHADQIEAVALLQTGQHVDEAGLAAGAAHDVAQARRS